MFFFLRIVIPMLPCSRNETISGLYIVTYKHDLQRGNCTRTFTRRITKYGYVPYKKCPRSGIQDNQPQEQRVHRGMGASMHMMSKSDFTRETQDTIRKSTESSKSSADDPITQKKEATVSCQGFRHEYSSIA